MDSKEKVAPLEDLMVAMDVVDTLRHREQLVDRELDSDARRERLIDKLRGIYQAQGIEVTDQVLADGVRALEEDRFKYSPPEKSFSSWLAGFYISRDKWLKPLLLMLALIVCLWIFYFLMAVRPASVAEDKIPEQLRASYGEVIQLTNSQVALKQALELKDHGELSVESGDLETAQSMVDDLKMMSVQLKSAYQIRVVQEPGESSGVWRIPDDNPNARNYYLIVEAIDSRGNVLSLPVTSEETGKVKVVKRWGIRVEKYIYQAIGADKKDDGIIQNRKVGIKQRGQTEAEYNISTNASAITDW